MDKKTDKILNFLLGLVFIWRFLKLTSTLFLFFLSKNVFMLLLF